VVQQGSHGKRWVGLQGGKGSGAIDGEEVAVRLRWCWRWR
jgi:hypothetical protein